MRSLTFFLGIVLAAGLGLSSLAAQADNHAARLTERVLGQDDAPLTIIEYSSLTCPHCASFHKETLPEIKKAYINTGKVKLIFRDFPFERVSLAGAMTARCLPEKRFFAFLELLFAKQDVWTRKQDPITEIGKMARLAGVSDAKFQECLRDENLMNTILERRQDAEKDHRVESTPSFIIDGKKYSGARSFSDFKKIIDGALN